MANKRIKDLATTITAFRTGDVIPVDGPSGTAKMGKDSLLDITRDGRAEKEWFETFTESKVVSAGKATFSHKFFKGQKVIVSVASTSSTTAVYFKSASATDEQTPIGSATIMKMREYISEGDYTTIDVQNASAGCVVTCTILSHIDTAKDYADKVSRIVQTSFSNSDLVNSFINPEGSDISSTTRKRTRFIYINGGCLSVICRGYDYRVSFFNNNLTGSSYLVKPDMDENQNWQDGDKGTQISVPDGAINFIVSVRRKDNGTFTSSDKPVIIASMFGQVGFMAKIFNGTSFADSTTSIISTPTPVDDFANRPNFVAVSVPTGYKARVLEFYNTKVLNSNIYMSDYHTSDFVQSLYTNTTFYCVQLKKTDESTITDIDYLDCKIEETDNPFYGKVISILGDSISTFGGSASDPDNARYAQVGDPTYTGNRCRYPQTNLLTNVNDTYWMRLIGSLGLKLGINESWAGSRVSNTSATDTGDVGPNRCISSMTRIGHLDDNGTPDIILVNAGTNDIGNSVTLGTFNYDDPSNYTDAQIAALDVSTFADAYRAMLIRLQKTYPSARIIVMLPNYTTSYYNPKKEDQYCEIVKEACDYFGVPYIDMRTAGITMFNRSTYLPDGIHYNASGMTLIYEKVKLGFEINL